MQAINQGVHSNKNSTCVSRAKGGGGGKFSNASLKTTVAVHRLYDRFVRENVVCCGKT
jgi:hypothetical protein